MWGRLETGAASDKNIRGPMVGAAGLRVNASDLIQLRASERLSGGEPALFAMPVERDHQIFRLTVFHSPKTRHDERDTGGLKRSRQADGPLASIKSLDAGLTAREDS